MHVAKDSTRVINMIRMTPLLAILVLLLIDVVRAATKPNFLLIHLDDVGYGDFSFYSEIISKSQIAPNKAKISKTPQIDAIAKEGIAFSSYYASACVCSPSRAGILTGRYPIRTTVFPGVLGPDDDHGLPPQEITIARWLKEKAGYRTFMVGKWHLGHMEPFLPTFHGFERWTGMPYSHDFCACPSSLTNTADNQCRSWDPPCPIMNGTLIVEQPAILDKIVDYYVAATIESIDEALRLQTPFFGYYACHHAHHPQFAKKSNIGKSAELGGRPDAYGDAVWEMDDAIGRIVEYIRKRGIEDKTFVFITSDNGAANVYGELAGSNAPLRCGKGTTWEGGQRVPLVVWGGGTRKGKILNDVVAGMDIFPTISELAGVSVESHPRALDGIDFSRLLTKEAIGKRNSFFYYSLTGNLDAVRIGDYKVHFRTSLWVNEQVKDCHPPHITVGIQVAPLVYNIVTDPSEKIPLPGKDETRKNHVLLAEKLVKEHKCLINTIRTSCDVSNPVHCFTASSNLLPKAPWPPKPFVPWTQGARSCCSYGFDKVLPNWKDLSTRTCRKIVGELRGCDHTNAMQLCNPSLIINPQCGGRAVCANTKLNDSIETCGKAKPDGKLSSFCEAGWNVVRCPIGFWQCRGSKPSGDVRCMANPKHCETFEGIVYTNRPCGICSTGHLKEAINSSATDPEAKFTSSLVDLGNDLQVDNAMSGISTPSPGFGTVEDQGAASSAGYWSLLMLLILGIMCFAGRIVVHARCCKPCSVRMRPELQKELESGELDSLREPKMSND